MGRFAPKYAEEERAAIVAAVLDQGLSAPAAVKLAAAGTLEGVGHAFEMPAGTARELVRREREDRDYAVRATPEGAASIAEAIPGRIVRLLDAELARIEKEATDGDKLDTAQLRNIARVHRELATKRDANRAARDNSGTDTGDDRDDSDGAKEDDLIKRLVRDAVSTQGAQAAPVSTQPTPQPTAAHKGNGNGKTREVALTAHGAGSNSDAQDG